MRRFAATNRLVLALATILSLAQGQSTLCGAEPADESVLREPAISAADRDHWAFRPLLSPELPSVRDAAWPINAIDRFVLARLEAAELSPQPAADRVALLRRATFDLTGLPPTPEAIENFLADASAEAFECVVDRLLASPEFGERMAQHWLDLARFAETDGFEFDHVRPDAWKYRDWVIAAFNADMPYDEFVMRQIAGDLPRANAAADPVATGFLLCGPDMPDLNSQQERRHNVLNEMTATVGATLLGLQVGCAQCHDHKYDPISQADFYRLRACFDTAEFFNKSGEPRTMRERTGIAGESRLMLGGDFRRPGPAVAPGIPRICNPNDGTGGLPEGLDSRRAALAKWLVRDDHGLALRAIANRLWQWHFGQGLSSTPNDFGYMGQPPSHPELLDWLASELPRCGWSLKRMHRAIVTSATYRQASRPSADDASRRCWQAGRERDPRNELFWHAPRRRLDGEAIRDAMLAAAGQLNRERGGPGVMAPLPPELEATLLKGQWTTHPDERQHRRRSVFLFVRRNLQFPLFESFDRPDALASCPGRNRSTTASQALAIWNSDFSWRQARAMAGRAASESTLAAAIDRAWRLSFGRVPNTTEGAQAITFLTEQADRLRAEGRTEADLARPDWIPPSMDAYTGAALVDLCLALFNANEFVYID